MSDVDDGRVPFSIAEAVNETASGSILEMRVLGDVHISAATEVIDRIRERAAAGHNLVLLDVSDVSTLPGTLMRYRVALHAAKVWPRSLRVAALGRPDIITNMFAATTQLRGFAVHVFTDRTAARTWLAGDQRPD